MISEIKLHEIPAALAGMLDLIQVDEETGEIEPATLESVQIASEEKIIATAMYIRRLDALNKATKETIQDLQERVRADSKRIEALKWLMTKAMDSLQYTEVKSPEVTLRFRKSSSVEITDSEALPEQFLRTKTVVEPDKTAIKNALKAGEKIQGAQLVESRNLQIK
jgi:hypothetical protein